MASNLPKLAHNHPDTPCSLGRGEVREGSPYLTSEGPVGGSTVERLMIVQCPLDNDCIHICCVADCGDGLPAYKEL